MNTHKKIILGLGTLVVLTTGAIAHEKYNNFNMNYHQKMQNIDAKHHRQNPIIHTIMQLDLEKSQRSKIDKIIKESKKSIEHPNVAFSDATFNKEKFISVLKNKENHHIEAEAQMIADIYQVLNTLQKKNLKTILDMQEIKRNKMIQHMQKDKRCKN